MQAKTSMRVVGGKAKGRRLRGTVSPGGRPTTERVRAAIFNILSPELYQGQRILDLYAGSASLGIEALSRGAGWADFVEQDWRQCEVIRANLEDTGFSQQAKVYRADVVRVLGGLSGPYQLVLMDPPYRLQNLGEVLEKIASVLGLVDNQGIVVVGHSKRQELLSHYGPLELESHRRYGDNVVDFYIRR
jgi:16S rRNA (guanine966-N2)-methyltransferase